MGLALVTKRMALVTMILAQVTKRVAQVAMFFGAGAKKGWQPAPRQKAKWLITSYLPQIDGAGHRQKIAPAPLSRPPAPKSW